MSCARNDGIFSPHQRVQTSSGAHSDSNVLGALTQGVKWLECEADHSPPSNAEVKNAWICTSTLTVSVQGVVLN
jgi:hypothetical protein